MARVLKYIVHLFWVSFDLLLQSIFQLIASRKEGLKKKLQTPFSPYCLFMICLFVSLWGKQNQEKSKYKCYLDDWQTISSVYDIIEMDVPEPNS